MALALHFTWQVVAEDSRAQNLGVEMDEDLFDERPGIYMSTATIKCKLNKLSPDSPGLAFGRVLDRHLRKHPNLGESEIELFRKRWVQDKRLKLLEAYHVASERESNLEP